ncbi:MAG: DUF1552 domain-containing protein [Polyangiaceae bacterium]
MSGQGRQAPPRGASRRRFLRGAGGLLLALPFLEGLEPRPVSAEPKAPRKRFVSLATQHGGSLGKDLHPPQASLTEAKIYAGQQVRRGDLSLGVSGETASLSPILSAGANKLTPTLVSKMNVIRGLSVPFYTGHHRGGHLGNWDIDGDPHGFEHIPTIDQVMAWSPSFYETTPLVRSMVCANGYGSFNWQNPVDRTGPVSTVAAFASSMALFQSIYVPPPGEGDAPRAPVVDRVLADYQRLRGSARLSGKDRERLDAHLQKLAELEQKLGTVYSCEPADPPGDTNSLGPVANDVAKTVQYWKFFFDVVAMAFACDTSRIAVLPLTCLYDPSFYAYPGGGWHESVAHQAGFISPHPPEEDPSGMQNASYRTQFAELFLYLLRKLDEIDEGEGTVLDNSLVAWTFEAGIYTHDSWDIPVITAGSAGGEIVTGKHLDYRDMDNRVGNAGDVESDRPERIYTGLTWQQYLGTVLQVMGLDPGEYESGGKGYGQHHQQADSGFEQHSAQVLAAQGDLLPLLKA